VPVVAVLLLGGGAVVLLHSVLSTPSAANHPSVRTGTPGNSDDNGLSIDTGGGSGSSAGQRAMDPPSPDHGKPSTPVADPPANTFASNTHPSGTASPSNTSGQAPTIAAPAPLPGAFNRLTAAAGSTNAPDPTPVAPVSQVTDTALQAVVQNGEGNLQLCYQNALRRNPALGHARVSVDVSISAGGNVTQVDLPPDTDPNLGGCMSQLIRNWSFPANPKDYQFSFPVVFRSE
jgi:hypothetical protein